MQLYLHIPFCKRKCAYCDFNSSASADDALVFAYLNALKRETGFAAAAYPFAEIKTVYIGGGTPSLLSCKQFESVMRTLSDSFCGFAPAEITVEVNPESLTAEKLSLYRDCGVNRVSMGVQSLNDDNLRRIGRLHDAKMALEKAELAARYFGNVSADFIIGLPYDTVKTVVNEIEEMSPYVSHMSVYGLTLEEGTPLALDAAKGNVLLPTDDEASDCFDAAADTLAALGFQRYEISNFAKKHMECAHNLGYWTREEYIGLGAGAHSFVKTSDGKTSLPQELRFSNPRDMHAYIGGVNCVSSFADIPRAEFSVIDGREAERERIMLGLRTARGVESELLDGKITERVKGFFRSENGRTALTRRGFEVMNSVLTEII